MLTAHRRNPSTHVPQRQVPVSAFEMILRKALVGGELGDIGSWEGRPENVPSVPGASCRAESTDLGVFGVRDSALAGKEWKPGAGCAVRSSCLSIASSLPDCQQISLFTVFEYVGS
jgi:hypothetical protein